ncbi:MAG: tetratricopeptide repeat protein, partial [Gemmatimonadales bacterium]
GVGPARATAAATRAFRYRDRLPPLERYLTTAYYYANVEFDRPKVVAAYHSALEVDPDDLTSLNNLALTLVEARRWAEAESLALRGIALGHIAPLFVNAADALVAQGKTAAAWRILDVFEQRAPGHPMLLMSRAGVAAATGRYDSSEAPVQTMLRTNPSFTWQAYGAGWQFGLDQLRGRLAAAQRSGRRLMALSEERGLPGSYLAAVTSLALLEVRSRNRPQAALEMLDAGLSRFPLARLPAADRPYAHLIEAYAEAGRVDRAQALLREYEAAEPETVRRGNPARHGATAAVALAQGRVADAIAAYRAWYEGAGCNLCGLHELGRAFERAGEPDSAITAYERAVAARRLLGVFDESSLLPHTYRRLGALYEQRGDRVRAREYYERFVDLFVGADAELQPMVREAKAKVARLGPDR